MKTIFFTAILTVGCGLWSSQGFAQGSQPGVQKKEEIIIQKNGQAPSKMMIEIDSNQITVNGKPLSAFNGNVTIRKRKFMDGMGNDFFDMPGESMQITTNHGKALLGVFTAKNEKGGGALIKNVINGSSAEKAGLQNGDVITKVNDKTIDTPQDLSDVIGSMKPGDDVTITILRNGKEKTLKAELGQTQDNTVMLNGKDFRGMMQGMQPFGNYRYYRMPLMPRSFDFNFSGNQPKLGLKIEDTQEGNGVKVLEVKPGSAADKAGIKKDDVITEINGEKVSDVNDIKSEIMKSENKDDYKIKAQRNNSTKEFDVHIPKVLKSINI